MRKVGLFVVLITLTTSSLYAQSVQSIDKLQFSVQPPKTEKAENELYKGKVFTMGNDTYYCMDANSGAYNRDTHVEVADYAMYSKVEDGFGMTTLTVTVHVRTDYHTANAQSAEFQSMLGSTHNLAASDSEGGVIRSIRGHIFDVFTHGFKDGTYTHVILYELSERWRHSTIMLWDNSGMIYSAR